MYYHKTPSFIKNARPKCGRHDSKYHCFLCDSKVKGHCNNRRDKPYHLRKPEEILCRKHNTIHTRKKLNEMCKMIGKINGINAFVHCEEYKSALLKVNFLEEQLTKTKDDLVKARRNLENIKENHAKYKTVKL
jgi:hypothetical protein